MIKRISIIVLLILFVAIPLICSHSSYADQGQWKVSTPEAEGMNKDMINKLFTEIDKGAYGKINSLLIIKNGKIIAEKYDDNNNKYKLHAVMSVTKSVTSVLAGIAIDQGKIKGLNEKVKDFFPEYSNSYDSDKRKQTITLKNLLTMTAGFDWEELGLSVYDENSDIIKTNTSDDPIKSIFEHPMACDPGKIFNYNSGCPLLISSIIDKAYGVSADKFAEKYLFKPLGINKYQWYRINSNTAHTGGGLCLTPRDLAKIGQLFLQNGKWEGKQIVSEKWVKESTRPQVICPGELKSSWGYGYYWWIFPYDRGYFDEENYIYAATGYQGQFMFVIPKKNMVIVSTAENDGEDFSYTIDRVEDIKEPTMQEIRYLDKLIDELAKGKSMDKILREKKL